MSSNISSKIYYYSLIYIAVTIPFQLKFLPFSLAIIAVGLLWIFGGNLSQKIKKFIANPYVILMSGLYLFYLISLLYSENTTYGFNDLVLKLPLILLPLFLSTTEKLKVSQYNSILKTFAISTFFATIITLIIAYYNYLQTGLLKYFFYQDLTIFMHSAYYALYALFAIAIFIYLIHHTQKKKHKIIYASMAFGLVVFLFLLSSRMQLLIFFLLLTVYIIAIAYQKKRILLGVTILVLGYVFIFVLATSLPKTSVRINQTKKHFENMNYSKTNSDSRGKIWDAAFSVVKQNYLLGTGVGDVKDMLIAQYVELSEENAEEESQVKNKIIEIQNNQMWLEHIQQKAKTNNISVEDQLYLDAIYVLNANHSRYKYFVKKGYNYHGQFLQTLAAVGVLGFIFLLFSILLPAYKLGWKKQNYLLLALMFMLFTSFITESMLERQAGVIFYAFFSSLLIVTKKEISDKSV